MPTFIMRNGLLVDKQTGERMALPADWKPVAPRVQADIEPYRSPITGEIVGGRAARRDDLKKHDCIDAREFSRTKAPRREKYKLMMQQNGR